MVRWKLCVGAVFMLAAFSVACGGGQKEQPREQPKVDASSLSDFGRDITQIAAGVGDAPVNFADDLTSLVDPKPLRPRVDALAQALSKALKGRTVGAAQAEALTAAFVAAASGGDLSKAKADINTALSAIGVPAADIAGVADAAAQLSSK
ncbi:MAG: hypothetical protein NTY02_18995 [Acidobacteria bacterium]|nr:hypothetical protein [Acidobacteriota bacterium]